MSLASEIAAHSPAGLWWCEEPSGTTLVDSSGNGRDGTIDGTVTLNATNIIPNRVNGAWDLNAIEGGEIATNTWANSATGITAGVWVYLDTLSSEFVAMARSAVNSANSRANKAWAIQVNASGAVLGRCYSETNATAVAQSSNGVVTTGALVFLTFTQTTTHIFYHVNGVQVATNNLAGGPVSYANNTRPISIGRQSPAVSYQMDGRIKGAFYLTTALNTSQILAIYNAGIAASGETGSMAVALPAPVVSLSGTHTPPAYTGALAADLVAFEAAFAGTHADPPTGTFGADLPPLDVTITGGYLASEADGSIDALIPAVTITLSGSYTPPPITGTLDVDLPGVDTALDGAFIPTLTGSLTADLPAVEFSISGTFSSAGPAGTFVVTLATPEITLTGTYSGPITGDTDNDADGLVLDGTATWAWTADIAPLPGGFYPRAHGVEDVAQAFSAVTINGAHPTYTPTYARQARLRQRIVMGGQDVSFFRGYETVLADYQLVEPFLYSTATLVFPQILPTFETLGTGSIAFLAKETRVSIESVDDETGTVVSVDYKGRVAAWNPQGRDLRVELTGEVRGPASTRYKPPPLIPWRRDMGHLTARMLRNLGVDARPRLGAETGYILGEPGGGWMLEHLEDMHAQAWTLGGDQWTTMPDAAGVYRTALKDRETVHMTAYPDDTRVVVDLRSDITEEPNRIFGHGTTPDGMVVNNGVYPGMIETKDVPAFPGEMSEGDSGDDVTELIHRLRITRYMNANEAAGGFDADVVDAVKDLQEDAGLPQTGVVNLATWRALWDLDVTGFSVRGAQIVPMAQRDYTREWFHAGGGGFTSRNDDYDPNRQKVDLPVEYGGKQRRNQMVRRSKALLAGVEEQWVGTIRVTTGAVVAGDHTPGTPITSVMRATDIKPGMNIKLPTMLGDRLLHIAGVNHSGRDVTLAVDTKARDAVPVWQIHERNRESRKDPNRTWLREYRSSNMVRDTVGEYSEVGGLNDRRRTLVPGEWIVFEVISGPIEGTIRSLKLSCGSGVEFAVAVFGMKMNAARMNNLVPDPLSAAGRDRWKDPDIRQNLEDRVLLYAAGVEDDPCGYWPDKKSEGASIITGDWKDDAEFSYRTIPPLTSAFVEDVPLNRFAEPVLYVAVYANANGYVRPGRVMWPQAEGGV